MICVYSADCTDFSNNGIGSVFPQSCTVTETINGEYELTLVHPLDSDGKWKRLAEGHIIRAPVPAGVTPQVDLTQLPDTGTEIYKITTNRDPLRLRSGTGTNYKILAKYKKGTEIIVLNKTTDSWYEVSCPDGKHGYMASKYLTHVRTEPDLAVATGEVIESRQLRDQPFRIYRVVPELDKITAYARHVFYDLLDNMIKSYKPSSSTVGASVVQGISAACQTEHAFTFYSDLESTAEDVEYVHINPVEALLSEDGVVNRYAGELQRDWFDVFLVQRIGHDKDVQIRQGKNLLGISYDVDLTNVTTRIMPTGEDKDGEILYLPELFIDSPHVGSYIQPKWMHLPVSDAKEVTSGDGKKTKAQCYEAMRNAVQAEYDAGCDQPIITLKVDFINCAETVEYAQYAALQNIFLGDSVRVIARRIGVEVSMRMTQYTYDCLTRKYTAMTLGTVASTIEGNMISSRQLASGSIPGNKLVMNSVGSLHLEADSVHSQHVAAESITTEKLAAAVVTAEKLAAGAVDAGALSAVTARIASLTAGDIETDTLAAGLAAFTVITCGTASFDRATVTHLVAEALNLSFGVGDEVFINNLKVAYAQVVAATIGNLCIKASDGNYYLIDVDANGNVSATMTSVSDGEITAGQTDTGKVILETDILATNLATSNLLATYALVNKIDAARIDVDELFARKAFIAQLTTSEIIGGKSLTIIAGEAAEAKEKADSAVAQVQVLYASGPSYAVAPAGGWSTVAPTHQEGQYIWQKTVTTYNNGETDTSMPTCLSGADGEPATTLRIDSSRGTVFKNNAVSTVLTAIIYRAGLRITDISTLRSTFGSGAYLQWSWQRMDEERFGVISADDARISSDGFSFTLSPEDVDTKVTFMCELITD